MPRALAAFLVLAVATAACDSAPVAPSTSPTVATTIEELALPTYLDPNRPPMDRARDLVGLLTIDELIGQMALIELGSISPGDITAFGVGGVLSGGGGAPLNNTPAGWVEMITEFQDAASATRLGIPIIYGTDAVHGHGNLAGATIFPHNIGLGATGNEDLVEEIGQATALELLATGVSWNFGPVLAVPLDPRWGRTYEAFGDDPDLVGRLGSAYIRGLEMTGLAGANRVIGTAKHFVGDGGTVWGTSTSGDYRIDQGLTGGDESVLRQVHLAPYRAAFDTGVGSVMASFSSWRQGKVHGDGFLLTRVLRGELGFGGLLVSDWGGIDQIFPGEYRRSLTQAINSGIDFVMVPYDVDLFVTTMRDAVEAGEIGESRIREAVTRILTAKFEVGLFERAVPVVDAGVVGSEAHRSLARRAVAESIVVLKAAEGVLPIDRQDSILVAGLGADDIGIQSGGWTLSWQGRRGDITEGTTILEALAAVTAQPPLYNSAGRFDSGVVADIGIAVIHEMPYAEGVGDSESLTLSEESLAVVDRLRPRVDTLIVIQISGRPTLLGSEFDEADVFVQAWLPGTEGAGIVDVLIGTHPVTGVLPIAWPSNLSDLGLARVQPCDHARFPRGYGLAADGESLAVTACLPG